MGKLFVRRCLTVTCWYNSNCEQVTMVQIRHWHQAVSFGKFLKELHFRHEWLPWILHTFSQFGFKNYTSILDIKILYCQLHLPQRLTKRSWNSIKAPLRKHPNCMQTLSLPSGQWGPGLVKPASFAEWHGYETSGRALAGNSQPSVNK